MIGDFFQAVLVKPIITILVLFYQILNGFHVPFAFGFSIILLTIFIRFVLYPLTHQQLKATKKMQQVSPHISKIKEKHKGDNMRIQQETMRLYKEHGINPAAGCLPMLIQMPILFALYPTLSHIINLDPHKLVAEVNKLVYINAVKLTHPWDPTFFGIPLGKNPEQLISHMPLILLVPLLTGVLQFIQTKMMSPVSSSQPSKNVKDKKEGSSSDDFAQAFQTQSLYFFPALIAFFSYRFPIGLSLYWNTFTLFGILQQYRIGGFGGLMPILQKIRKKK